MEEKNTVTKISKNLKAKSRFFNKNFLIRIISLICAILLWMYVSEVESPTSEKNFEAVAVTLRNKDVMFSETDMSVVSNAVYETNIVLSGKKSTLNKIDYDDITATVDMSKITDAGTHELKISIEAPTGTTVISTNPKYITITVDKTVARSFEITPEVNYSNLPSTYELGDCIITDIQSKVLSSVSISGPATELDRIDKVVARADFGSISSSVEAKTNLLLLDSYGEEISTANMRLATQSVIIKQPVYITKTLPLTVSQANNTFSDSQISFKINPSTVQVKGDPKILEELDSITLDPINERAIGEAMTTTVNSLIKLPESVELVSSQNTATITASVKNVKCHYLTLTPENIAIKNKADFLDIAFHDTSWTFVIINASSKVLTADDLYIEIDLSKYIDNGLYTINLEPQFKEDISYAYSPYVGYTATFELSKKVGE